MLADFVTAAESKQWRLSWGMAQLAPMEKFGRFFNYREMGNSGQIVGKHRCPSLHRYTTAVGGRRERGVPPRPLQLKSKYGTIA